MYGTIRQRGAGWETHLNYAYNRLGEITIQKVTIGSEVLYQHYTYNQQGLLESVILTTDGLADTEPAEVTYSYTATGAVDSVSYRGGTDVLFDYTLRDWVASINDINSPNGSFAAAYGYKKNGNISKAEFHNPQISLTSEHNHYHWNFGYDGLSRLLSADYGTGSSTASAYFDVSGLSYDAAGNITALQRDDESGGLIDDLGYSYVTGTNRLQSVTDSVAATAPDWDAESATFGYDANGNLISQTGKLTDVAGACPERSRRDHRNLPVHFYLDGGAEVVAGYDAEGQRILKELKGGGWQFYVMDGPQTLAVIDQDGLSHINLVGNSTIGRIEADASGNISLANARRYYITDHLGSTRAVVDNNGNVLETFDYYPFGLLMPKRNTASANTTEKFSGKELDENTNQYYFGARYYDPALGRFFVVDRFADKYPSMTPYQYAVNNPMNFIDVNGDSVNVSDLTENERKFLINSLSKVTGYSKGQFKITDGILTIADSETTKDGVELKYASPVGGSEIARNDLNKAIDDKKNMINVISHPTLTGVPPNTNNILLQVDDARQRMRNVTADLNPETLGIGLTLFHELQHTKAFGSIIDPKAIPGVTGPVVDHVNNIRKELDTHIIVRPSYLQRTQYGTIEQNLGNGKTKVIYKFTKGNSTFYIQ